MKFLSLLISIIFYFIGVAGLLYLIFWKGDLLPFDPIHEATDISTSLAIVKNLGLLVLFSLQHTIMARPSFKEKWTKIIPVHLERSFYVFISGILCLLIVWQWTPIEGTLWQVTAGSVMYYILYGMFFFGIVFLFASTFLINHFELFGLQQAYFNLKGKQAPSQSFKEILLYKIVRHPIYLGFLLILWGTAHMTMTHFSLVFGFTIYIFIGIAYEEKDLIQTFGNTYLEYKNRVPKVIPFIKQSINS